MVERRRSICRSLPPWRLILLAVGAILVWGTSVPLNAQAVRDPLSNYLRELQFPDLLAVHLQRQLDKANDDATIERLARDLVELYEDQIQSGKLDDATLASTLQKLEGVLLKAPQLRTPELDILTLQAEYQQAFLQLSQWIEDQTLDTVREQAVAKFTELTPRFESRRADLDQQVQQFQQRIDREDREAQIDQILAQQGQVRSAWLRATYYAAWNQYYRVLGTTSDDQRQQALAEGRRLFSEFLGLDPESDYELADAESLELEADLRARAGLGLAILEALDDQPQRQQRWFEWLQDPRVSTEVQQDLWNEYILAMLLQGRDQEALEPSRGLVREFKPPPRLPDVRLSRTLARFGEYARLQGSAAHRSLRSLGYEGLVRERQFQLALDLLQEFDAPPPDPTNFFLGWLAGYQTFVAAEQTKKPEDFRQAAEQLTRAAELPSSQAILQLRGYFEMQLGWSWYQAGEYEAAAAQFANVPDLLKSVDQQVAVDAIWMQALSWQQLAETHPRGVTRAIEAFQRLVLEFPTHPKAADARYQIGRLERQAGSEGDPVAALERITTDNPNYALARFEICLVRFDQWKNAPPEQRVTAYQNLETAVNQFVHLGSTSEQSERRLRAYLLLLEAAIAQDETDTVDAVLTSAFRLAQARATDSLVTQLHYWKLVQAQKQNDPATLRREAEWLAESGQGDAYRQAGLVYLTQAQEQAYADAKPQDRATLSQDLIPQYRKLVELLGDSPTVLTTQKNARVALYKLGWHAQQIGDSTTALAAFERLIRAFPDEATYLRAAGLAAYRLGQYRESVGYWSQLSRGLPSGSASWFEARYYELDSLRRFDRDQAQKAWRQFRLLHPEVPDESWRSRYDELEQALN